MNPDLPIQTTKISGTPTENTWSQALVLPIPLDEDRSGKLLLVIEVSRQDDEDAAFLGRQLIEAIQKQFSESKPITETLHQIKTTVSHIIEQEQANLTHCTAIVGGIVGEAIHILHVGEGDILLFRGDRPVSISPKKHKQQIITGKLRSHDYIILGTDTFLEHANPSMALFDGQYEAQDIGDVLLPVLLATPENADIAGVIASCGTPEEIMEAPPQPVTNQEPILGPVNPPPQASIPPTHPLLTESVPALSSSESRPIPQIPTSIAKPPTNKIESMRERLQFIDKAKELVLAHKKIVLMAGGVIAVAVVILFLGMRFMIMQQQRTLASLLASAKHDVAVAQSLKGQDNNQAVSLIEKADAAIETIRKKDKNYPIPQDLLDTIAQQKKELLAVVAIENPEVVFNLTLIKDSFSGSKLTISGDNILAVDTAAPTLLRLDSTKKTGRIISGGGKLPNFINAAIVGDDVVALTQDAIVKVNEETGDTKPLMSKDALWNNITDITGYANNLYLLDQGKGQIWKYGGNEATFSAIKNLVTETEGQTLTNPVNFAIDGNIWVIQQNGIVSVVNGKIIPFDIGGTDTSFGSMIRIGSNDESKNLYILDRDNGRIVVVTKDGHYVKQYKASILGSVNDVALSPNEDWLYLLTKDKVYRIPLTL